MLRLRRPGVTESKRAVLITGGGARLGSLMSKALADDGYAVAIHYNRSKAGAEAVRDAIIDTGRKAAIVQANLNVPGDRNTLIARASEALGAPLTALINNASTFTPDAIDDFTDAGFDHHINANLRAPLHLTQAFAAQYSGPDAGGCVINILDQRVLKPNPEFLTYSIAKAALHWSTKTLAQSLAPAIRVNGIGPGPTLKNARQSDDDFAAERAATLLREGSAPGEIIAAARYLLSARAVTGQMIAVDGGQHLTWKTADFVGESLSDV